MTAPLGTKHRHNPKQSQKTQFRHPLGSEAHRRGYPGLSRPWVVSSFHASQIPRSFVSVGMLGISMLFAAHSLADLEATQSSVSVSVKHPLAEAMDQIMGIHIGGFNLV